jgi:hypothetical protein
VIQTGAFNDRFIEVLEGLQEGQKVLLNPPRLMSGGTAYGKAAEGAKDASPATPAAAPETGQTPPPSPDAERPERSEEDAAPDSPKDRFKEMDKNGDGKISLADETPEQARQFLERLDADKDGFIDAGEMEAAKKSFGEGRKGTSGRQKRPREADGEQGPSQ